jgi:hypothetical protein
MRNSSRAQLVGVAVAFVVATALTSGVQAQEGWQWSITPYIWATDVSEDLILDGAVVGGEDTEFGDLVDKIDSSLQLHFEGSREKWGLFTDINYVELSDSETGEMGLGRLDVNIEEAVFELGAIYRPGGRTGRFDLLFGARLMDVAEDYRLQVGDLPPTSTSVDESYLDALIGARYQIPLSDRWGISLRGDISAGGTDFMWTAQGLVGWRFGAKRNSAVFLGYRYRDTKYSKAEVYEVKKTLSGVGLGVKIGF